MLIRIVFFILGLCCSLPSYATDTPPALPAVPPAAPASPEASSTASSPPTTTDAASSLATPAEGSAFTPEPPPKSSDYILPTWIDLLHTMVRFNAIDLQDNNLLDEYASVTDCEIFQYYYKDDFKWNAIRKRIRDSSELNQTKYPVHYYFYTVLELDRYDFDRKLYRFKAQSATHNVNVFSLYEANHHMCMDQRPLYIPTVFQAVSDIPFSSAGLPLEQQDAQSLLRLMNSDRNTGRMIIVRFNMTVTYIDRLHKNLDHAGGRASYVQVIDNAPNPGTLRLNVHIDSVEFYEDLAMTKLIYTTKP